MGVRSANISDIKAMSYIHARTWKKAYIDYISREYLNNIPDDGWVPLFTRAFNENIHEAAVFETEGIITGTVTFGRGSFIDEGEIISLYVLPQFWSTGQGYQLTKFAVEGLKEQGFKSCYLWVIKENKRAVSFYKKFGFESTGELTTVMLAGLPVIEEKYRIYL